MEPLSAIASVAGIITAASKIIDIVSPYTDAKRKAPVIAAHLHSEALATKTILISLENLVTSLSSNRHTTSSAGASYASLIQVDQLVAILTEGVLLFAEFETALQLLPPLEVNGPGTRWLSSVQWVRKRGSLMVILGRLRAFKQSVDCILSIFNRYGQPKVELPHYLR